MAAQLPVDTTAGAWRQVADYARDRMVELTAQCVSTESSDKQRAEAAYRIAELAELLQAPSRVKAQTEHRVAYPPMGVY